MIETEKFLSIKEASLWASRHIGKDVTPSNIAYLTNFGRGKNAAITEISVPMFSATRESF